VNQSIPARRNGHSRRDFIRFAAASLAVGTTCGQRFLAAAAPAGHSTHAIPPLGVLLATTYKTGTLEERLDRAKAGGFDCVQMDMECVGLAEMPDEIAREMPDRIRRAAASRGIEIASVAGTFNMAHPDAEERKAGLRRLRVIAEACSGMGTSKIHICTGTRSLRSMWAPSEDNDKPDAWRDMADCVRAATDIARQANVVLGFEPEVGNVVDSAKKSRQILDEIGSPHLKVTLDPANLFHTGELPRMDEILDEAFALVGKDIVMTHAKDLDRDGAAGHIPAGTGKMDYAHFMQLLVKYNYSGPILLHGLSEEQVPGCLAFVRGKRDAALRSAT
jgi:sugar phosphate isomerase/epimerase